MMILLLLLMKSNGLVASVAPCDQEQRLESVAATVLGGDIVTRLSLNDANCENLGGRKILRRPGNRMWNFGGCSLFGLRDTCLRRKMTALVALQSPPANKCTFQISLMMLSCCQHILITSLRMKRLCGEGDGGRILTRATLVWRWRWWKRTSIVPSGKQTTLCTCAWPACLFWAGRWKQLMWSGLS